MISHHANLMYKFSYGHNRSKIRALHPKILGKDLSGA